MADKSFYEILGVSEGADATEIRKAYRALVLRYHPDRDRDPKAADRFVEIAGAWEVLGDPARRFEYDRLREINRKLAEESTRKQRKAAKQSQPQPERPSNPNREYNAGTRLKPDLELLVQYMGMARFAEAHALAQSILQVDPRQPLPYAALGDIARSRGDIRHASKMYAYAAQFGPGNAIFLRKHEETLEILARHEEDAHFKRNTEGRWVAPVVGTMLCAVGACYVALSPEHSIFAKNTVISSWTIGLISMLFFCGAVMGATLSLADFLDRFEFVNAFGKLSPQLVFMALAVVNLWVAGLLYLIVGAMLKSFSISISRMLLALVGVLAIMTIGSMANRTIDPYQVLMWGGSVATAGAVLGWAFADGMRG